MPDITLKYLGGESGALTEGDKYEVLAFVADPALKAVVLDDNGNLYKTEADLSGPSSHWEIV